MNDRRGEARSDSARPSGPTPGDAPEARLTRVGPLPEDGPAESLDITLAGGGEIVVGRDESCEVSLAAVSLSRRHARLVPEPGAWVVEDLGSTNGVYVNGQRVRSAKLEHGDELRLGTVSFTFTLVAPENGEGTGGAGAGSSSDPTVPMHGEDAGPASAVAPRAESALRQAMMEARPMGGGGRRVEPPTPPAPPGSPGGRMVYLFAGAAAAAALVIAGLVAYAIFAPDALDKRVEPAPPPPSEAAPVGLVAMRADFAGIANHATRELTLFRYTGNEGILVLDYPSLTAQGRALNRVIALVEDRGAPRDRVLNDADLASYIRAARSSPETFAFGHDYRAADMVRFFNLADRGGVSLNAEEERLRRILLEQRFMTRGSDGYLIVEPEQVLVSVPQEQADDPTTPYDERVEPLTRHTILRHELSHGEFFLNRAYREYSSLFWREKLTDGERAAFRSFLASRDYDPGNETLVINEMQAYLMHTPDTRLFGAGHLGVTQQALDDLRRRFLAGVPPSRFFADVASLAGTGSGG